MMSPGEILAATLADGVIVTPGPTGLRAAGPREACARWVPTLRENKAMLVDLLTRPHRLWVVRKASGEVWSISSCPPATLDEMRQRYPDAVSITPEVEQSVRPDPAPTSDQERQIRCWLDQIWERDRELVRETLDRCRRDAAAFDYFLQRALEPAEIPEVGR